MQLYALNSQKKLVFVEEAERKQNYFCPECHTTLRVRGGSHRRDHFYHLGQASCSMKGISLEHLQTQYFLKENLSGTVALEKRFPNQGRIADVVWEDEKIIFEVQCSPITAKEVLERNGDYSKLGYQVIWLLHEKNFNQKRLTAAEHVLRNSPHYYVDINSEGEGGIYDQHVVVFRGKRLSKNLPQSVRLSLRRDRMSGIRKRWPCHLEGTFDIPRQKREGWKNPFKRIVQALFYMLLERACR